MSNTIEYICLKSLLVTYPNNHDSIKNQYLSLLSNLTIVTDMSIDIFLEKINQIYMFGIIYLAIQHIDTNSNSNDKFKFKIIAAGTIIIEPKLIRGTKSVGHIEEIVVDPDFRGRGISTNIVNMLISYAKTMNSYKVILGCDKKLSKVYEKCGFKQKNIEMSFYL